jgi:hypothetical protein
MKDHTRRGIAYITGCIISDERSSTVYDYAFSKYFSFGGSTSNGQVDIYDYARSCYISGNSSGSTTFSLYHYGNSHHISLNLKDQKFDGYDYDTNSHFSGSVSGRSVSVFDYQDSRYYQYSI